MRLQLRLALVPLLLAPLLMGCAEPVVTEAPRLVIPDILKTCPAQPATPASNVDDISLANWIVDLAAAGQSCRDNLSSVVKVIGQ